MNQLFQFDGKLYEQIDGLAMDSPLGPLIANAFLCSIEEELEQDNKLPEFYRRYVDDTFATMKNVPAPAEDFLSTLNSCHAYINFTMEQITLYRYGSAQGRMQTGDYCLSEINEHRPTSSPPKPCR